MTDVLQMAGFLTFLQTEVAKVWVGGKRGLLVLPGVVGDGLVNTLHRLKQLGGGNNVRTVARNQSASGRSRKSWVVSVKMEEIVETDCSQASGPPPTGQLTGSRWAQQARTKATPHSRRHAPIEQSKQGQSKAVERNPQSLTCTSQSSKPRVDGGREVGGQPWHPSVPLSLGETTNLCASLMFVCFPQRFRRLRVNVGWKYKSLRKPMQSSDTSKKAVSSL